MNNTSNMYMSARPCVQPRRSRNNATKRDEFCQKFVEAFKTTHKDRAPSHEEFMAGIDKRCKEVDPGGTCKSLLGLSFHHSQLGKEVKNTEKKYRKRRERKNNNYRRAKQILLDQDPKYLEPELSEPEIDPPLI